MKIEGGFLFVETGLSGGVTWRSIAERNMVLGAFYIDWWLRDEDLGGLLICGKRFGEQRFEGAIAERNMVLCGFHWLMIERWRLRGVAYLWKEVWVKKRFEWIQDRRSIKYGGGCFREAFHFPFFWVNVGGWLQLIDVWKTKRSYWWTIQLMTGKTLLIELGEDGWMRIYHISDGWWLC